MPENNKTQELLQKLAPCIERGDLDACVEEAAGEMESPDYAIALCAAFCPLISYRIA